MGTIAGDPGKFNEFAAEAMMAHPAVFNALRLAAGMSEEQALRTGPLATVTAGWEALSKPRRHDIATQVFVPAYLSSSESGAHAIDAELMLAIIGLGDPPTRLGNGGTPRAIEGRPAHQ